MFIATLPTNIHHSNMKYELSIALGIKEIIILRILNEIHTTTVNLFSKLFLNEMPLCYETPFVFYRSLNTRFFSKW